MLAVFIQKITELLSTYLLNGARSVDKAEAAGLTFAAGFLARMYSFLTVGGVGFTTSGLAGLFWILSLALISDQGQAIAQDAF